jgi:hypothetical protein
MARKDRDMPDGVKTPTSFSTVDEQTKAQAMRDAAPAPALTRAQQVTAARLASSPIAQEAARTTAALKKFTAAGGLLGVPGSNLPGFNPTANVNAEVNNAAVNTAASNFVNAPTETTYTAPDGRIFTDLTAYNSYIQKTKDEEKRRTGQSAYDILFNEFDANGLGDLVQEVKQYIIDGLSPAEFTIKLRASKPYKMRFAANDLRIANGFAAIDESTYLKLEDSYQSIMQNYGLPASYYEKGVLGVQKGFQDLIGGNVDPMTLEDRIIEGQKITKGNKTVIDAAKRFFPSLTDGDFLAYVLNPKNGLDEIKRKVTAAEIGGAQIGAGLDATLAGAQELATAGVTGKQYQQAAPTIAEAALRGGQLSSIYKQDPYTQQTAEQAILDVPGSAEALKKTKKLTALESASFSGRSGAGAISRDRAGVL